jgi:glycosyltransferase involved in cell wall biosynthesis
MGTGCGKTIISFGYADVRGGRNWVVRRGLMDHGFRFIDCHTDKKGFFRKCADLTRKFRMMASEADIVLLPFMGHSLVPLAWTVSRSPRKTIVFDAFISLYDTSVSDRRLVHPWSPRAFLLRALDWLSCLLADHVLLDTEEQKEYFVRRYRVPQGKISVLPIGCQVDVFRPHPSHCANPTFTAEFHGKFIPLQGIETILRAAKELQDRNEDVQFELIGGGQTFKDMQRLTEALQLRNVTFPGFQSVERVRDAINHSDVCLGIFGTTDKADRVIPHKAYEVLACGKPLITGRTTASKRVFTDRENALLCEPGNGGELAERIIELKNDPTLRRRIAENGHRLSLERFQPGDIVFPLVQWLQKKSSSPASRGSSAATSRSAASSSGTTSPGATT